MRSSTKVVWLIDDSTDESNTYRQFLIKGGLLAVQTAKVQPNVADYVDLASDSNTGAIVIDQRLGDQSGVTYTGLSAANQLRVLFPDLPIYLLTNWARDISPNEGQPVESVIPKDELRKAPKAWIARILRAIGRYEASLDERQRRLRDLIKMRLAGTLAPEDELELEKLRADIEVPFEPIVTTQERARLGRIREQQECLEELRRIVNRLPSGSRAISGDQQVGGQ